MKRLIDKLKQQCKISIGSLALTSVAFPAAVLVCSTISLWMGLGTGGYRGFHRYWEWAFIHGSFIASIPGGVLAAIGWWFDEDAKKCDNALIIFVAMFFFWALIPVAVMPRHCS